MVRSNKKTTDTTASDSAAVEAVAAPAVEAAPVEAAKTKRARKTTEAAAAVDSPAPEPAVTEEKPKRGRKAAAVEAPAESSSTPAAEAVATPAKAKRGRKAATEAETAAPAADATSAPAEAADSPSDDTPAVDATPAGKTTKKRTITPEVLDAEITEFINGIEAEIKRVDLSENKSGAKYLKNLVRKARDIQKHAQKVKGKRAKATPAANNGDTPATPKAPSGIQKPVAIIPEFAKFLKVAPDTLMSRVEGGKAINAYAREKSLVKGKFVTPDKTLSKLLAFDAATEQPLTIARINKYMQRLFVKATPAV